MNGTLVVENIVKTFKGVCVVDDISFTVRKESFTALLGPNGSGKSTTLKMCTNMLQPDSGSIILNGTDISVDSVKALSGVGCVIETPEIYPDVTARRYLEYLGKVTGMTAETARSEADHVLETVGMSDHSDNKVGSFSKGMKQRIVLAQSLLGNPDMLILDEPTSGLDPKGTVEFNNILKKLNQGGKTILMSSHMLHEVEGLCDSAIIIDHGRMMRQGTIEDIIRKSTVMISTLDPVDAGIVSSISSMTGIVKVEPSEGGISVKIDGGPELQAALIKRLIDNGVRVYSVSKNDPLEEVFMDITGGHS